MTKKRFKSRCYEKQKNTVIYDEGDKLFDVSYRDFEDAYYLKMKLIPVVNKLNKLSEENKKFKHHIKKLEKELHLAHMRSMFSTVKSFKGDVSKRYYYSEETDRIYDSANHYGQYDKILDKKEIAMLLNEYETMLNGDIE